MGCVCIKDNIPFDKHIENIENIENIQEEVENQAENQTENQAENQAENQDNTVKFLSIGNASNIPNRIDSINTGLYMENSNIINLSNFADSVDFKKSSFLKRFNDKNSTSLMNLVAEDKNFDTNMLNLINAIRHNPVFLNEKIKEFIKYIKQDKSTNKSFFVVNNSTKINLLKGKEAFLSCCDFLQELSEKVKSKALKLENLELKEELKFPFPEQNPSICNKKEYITEKIAELNKKMQNKLRIKGFHYDMSPNNAETSLIMQIVDDNNSNGKRRNIIFDEKIKYIGISHGKIRENVYCVYMVFAS